MLAPLFLFLRNVRRLSSPANESPLGTAAHGSMCQGVLKHPCSSVIHPARKLRNEHNTPQKAPTEPRTSSPEPNPGPRAVDQLYRQGTALPEPLKQHKGEHRAGSTADKLNRLQELARYGSRDGIANRSEPPGQVS